MIDVATKIRTLGKYLRTIVWIGHQIILFGANKNGGKKWFKVTIARIRFLKGASKLFDGPKIQSNQQKYIKSSTNWQSLQ